MNSTDVIVSINSMNDIENITDNTKYINLSINNVDVNVIDYFLLHGQNYMYTDTIDNKNDVISFGSISTINNIWGALSTGKITNISLSKIFMYICSRIGINGEIINNSIKGNIANKINIKDDFIVVDLVYKILSLTENIINAYMIGTYELGEVYKYIFSKYCPNYDVRINNFYIFDGNREHFIVVNYNNKYYSYNYNKKKFIEVEYKDIYSNFENKKIGLYNNEDFLFNKEGVVVR